ncbi:hypothetical protein M514_19205 [Trichuris suis]|uniref:Uncharacterized protein n=1 Tax=Trichuris suis TaxID=68888 RepID=A0A085NGH6_9BILA|nr:hypothetical protein M514_19205 [Trichuris suis]
MFSRTGFFVGRRSSSFRGESRGCKGDSVSVKYEDCFTSKPLSFVSWLTKLASIRCRLAEYGEFSWRIYLCTNSSVGVLFRSLCKLYRWKQRGGGGGWMVSACRDSYVTPASLLVKSSSKGYRQFYIFCADDGARKVHYANEMCKCSLVNKLATHQKLIIKWERRRMMSGNVE